MMQYPGVLQTPWFESEDVASILKRTVTPEEHLRNFYQMVEFLADQAREALSKKSSSYRNFLVGAAAYAHNGETTRGRLSVRVFQGFNTKPSPDEAKHCAERRAIESAQQEGYTQFVGILVVGVPQADADSGLISPTLHPCSACRSFLTNTSGVSRETRILTVSLYTDEWEDMSMAELLSLHQKL